MNEFTELINSKSDIELLTIYPVRNDYQPEFISLLEREIKSRDLFVKILSIDNPATLSEEEIINKINDFLKLEKKREDELAKENNDNSASLNKRFANYFIDTITMIVIIVILITQLNLDEDVAKLISFLLFIVYYTLFEAFTGKTVGKYITNTCVINKEGKTPSLSNCIGRTLCRFIPFDSISYLFAGDWHDKISSTRVINMQKADKQIIKQH